MVVLSIHVIDLQNVHLFKSGHDCFIPGIRVIDLQNRDVHLFKSTRVMVTAAARAGPSQARRRRRPRRTERAAANHCNIRKCRARCGESRTNVDKCSSRLLTCSCRKAEAHASLTRTRRDFDSE